RSLVQVKRKTIMPTIPVYTRRQSIPGEAAGVPGDVASAGAGAGALADLGNRIAAVATDWGEKEARARRARDLWDRAGKAKDELTALELELKDDPDYTTKRARFDEKTKEIRERYSAGLDEDTKARFFFHYDETARS